MNKAAYFIGGIAVGTAAGLYIANEMLNCAFRNSASMEQRVLEDGRKLYSFELEGKVEPGNYQLMSEDEEAGLSRTLSKNVQIGKRSSKLMLTTPLPVAYSTTPMITNEDGSTDVYRPLRAGETLEDVKSQGPLEHIDPLE